MARRRGLTLAQVRPDLVDNWSSQNKLSAHEVKAGSNERGFWVCDAEERHEWEAIIGNVTRLNRWCPFCSRKRPSAKINLAVCHPEILNEWDFIRNEKSPHDYLPNSHSKVYWICKSGRSWKAAISKRTFDGHGCHYCSKQKASTETCLEATHPQVLIEWDFEKNKISPKDLSFGSEKEVWWICPGNHSYKMSPYRKLRQGIGCKKCSRRVSRFETMWLDQLGVPNDSKHRQVRLNVAKARVYADGYDAETLTVYEFHGDYFHGNPSIYSEDVVNPSVGKTFGELYANTQAKKFALQKAGFTVQEIWERDFLASLQTSDFDDSQIRAKISSAIKSYSRHKEFEYYA